MPTSAPITVWLVEDNAAFRKSVARAIESTEGMECTGDFGDFETAEAELQKGEAKPTMVLLDVGLPGLNGIDALSRIRELAPETRSVILTVFDDDDKIFRAICAGASGYLLKSSRVEAIADAIFQVAEGGAPMTPTVARRVLDLFTKRDTRRPGGNDDYNLTDREQDILRLMADGLIKKEIADSLDISVHTVSTHIRSIYEKLHVNTNTGAVAKAIKEDLI